MTIKAKQENGNRQPDANSQNLVKWQLAARFLFDLRRFKTISRTENGRRQPDASSRILVKLATGSQMPT